MLHKAKKTYDFTNVIICRMPSGEYREQPKWAPMISVVRSREYVAGALLQLRMYRRK